MDDHHCPAANTCTTSSHGDYFSYCPICLQHHLPIPHHRSGIEIHAEPTRLAHQEARATARYPGQHVYQPSTPTSRQPAGHSPQISFDEVAYQLNSLPGHYGPAFAFEVEREPRTPGAEALVEVLMQFTVDNAVTELDSQELGTPEQDTQGDSSPRSGFQREFRYLKDLIAEGLPTPPPTPPRDGDHVGDVSTHIVAGDAVRAIPDDAAALTRSARPLTPLQEDLGYLREHIIAGDAVLRTLPHGAATLTNPTPPVTPATVTQQSSSTAPAVTITSPPNPSQHSIQDSFSLSHTSASGSPGSPPTPGAWKFNYRKYAEEGYGTWEDDMRAKREALATQPLGTKGNGVLRVLNPMVPWLTVLETIEEEEEEEGEEE